MTNERRTSTGSSLCWLVFAPHHPSIKSMKSITAITRRVLSIDFYRSITFTLLISIVIDLSNGFLISIFIDCPGRALIHTKKSRTKRIQVKSRSNPSSVYRIFCLLTRCLRYSQIKPMSQKIQAVEKIIIIVN